jgi:nitric oxide reductase large subunit
MISINKDVLSYILSYTNLDIIKKCYLICHQLKKAIDNDLLWKLLFIKIIILTTNIIMIYWDINL